MQGWPVASVNWGAWAGSGMAAKAGVERMARLGFGAIEPAAGMAAISAVVAAGPSSMPAQLLASIFFWDRLMLILSPLERQQRTTAMLTRLASCLQASLVEI